MRKAKKPQAGKPRTEAAAAAPPKRLGLEKPCPECLGRSGDSMTDPRCPTCRGTGYVGTSRGDELMLFLAREGITPGIPAVEPTGHAEEEPTPRTPPPPSAFEEGDTTTFRGGTVHITSATYQWTAEPKGWVYLLAGIPGIVSEAELLAESEGAGVPENEPEQPGDPEGGAE